MSLTPGVRVGPYDIVAPLGAGGMGEVYRAKDTRLKREVALKILPESFASDPERLARFQREAEVLAALNHPHIAAIYGLEDADGVKALVMELVEGPTLADRIAQGPIPLDEALPIAKQIADALEAAHELGIIHRDLKPANIKVRDDGTVKVLDFGLAKALDPAASGAEAAALTQSPTITSPVAMTHAGVILGTAPYMAPEQARGKAVDKRADIWAFGCVLFEMLTGVRAFGGGDVTDTLAAVVRAEPSWEQLPANTPPAIRRLLRRSLEKDRRARLPDIGTARLEISDALAAHAEDVPPDSAFEIRGGLRTRVVRWAVAAVAVLAAFGVAAGLYLRAPDVEALTARSFIHAPDGWTLAQGGRPDEAGYHPMALSPDGRYIAFVARNSRGESSLLLRPLDAIEARVLPGTEGAVAPFWSPDSRSLGFFAGTQLKRVEVSGGLPTTISDAPTDVRIGVWSSTGSIMFSAYGTRDTGREQEYAVPASGGTPTPISLAGRRVLSVLPDGERFFELADATDPTVRGREVYLASIDSTNRKLVAHVDSGPVFYRQGYLLFFRDGALIAQWPRWTRP